LSVVRCGRSVLALFLVSAALGAGCGDDSGQSGGADGSGGGGDCKDAGKALTDAAAAHVGDLKLASGGDEGDAERLTVDVCRTTDQDAKATVIVYGLRDDSIRDVRHQLRLIKTGGLWQVTDDLDTRRCQKGRGQQDFSGGICG